MENCNTIFWHNKYQPYGELDAIDKISVFNPHIDYSYIAKLRNFIADCYKNTLIPERVEYTVNTRQLKLAKMIATDVDVFCVYMSICDVNVIFTFTIKENKMHVTTKTNVGINGELTSKTLHSIANKIIRKSYTKNQVVSDIFKNFEYGYKSNHDKALAITELDKLNLTNYHIIEYDSVSLQIILIKKSTIFEILLNSNFVYPITRYDYSRSVLSLPQQIATLPS